MYAAVSALIISGLFFLGSISVVNFQVSYYLASVEISRLGLHCRLVGYVEFWFILDDFFFFTKDEKVF